ncbi:glycosyl hydrolase [Massilia sp. G4R7]|uniref:Glycosyl hydrolase n=1 Tax=Massilia phyllostachyos TaxID=2898585 RepID=A0ABS8Q6H7_9BURK|nr:glycosyl hydrolase [Massilia phyllostachyos]MCD2517348.1 glycosyl hydrolase [Massilia phyllostachyos]
MTLKAACILLACMSAAHAAPLMRGPYKHVPQHLGQDLVLAAAPGGVKAPYVADGKAMYANATVSLAFATGECGRETWGKPDADALVRANVPAFVKAGVPYVISTGGAEGIFTCGTRAGMDRFLARYRSTMLAGFDFDIETGQTEKQVATLLAQVRHAQRRHPALRYSFTIATVAASDGSRNSLNATGQMVLRQLRKSGLRGYVINLMVMNYGAGTPASCVVGDKGKCDMGRSAIQAVRNVHERYKVPLAQLAITAMIGENDRPDNQTTVEDVRVMAEAAERMGLAGLHYWSLDRDTPCTETVDAASPVCSGLGVAAGEYARAFGLK